MSSPPLMLLCIMTTVIIVLNHHSIVGASIVPARKDYQVCPINNSPSYYCCQRPNNSSSTLFTLYHRPPSYDWTSKTLQINFPYEKYRPSLSPSFTYGSRNTCRIVGNQIKCGLSGLGPSLFNNSRDSSVFMTYSGNYRNNNATCDSGILLGPLNSPTDCKEVLLVDDYDDDKKPLKTFTEIGFLMLYAWYMMVAVQTLVWFVYTSTNKPIDSKSEALLKESSQVAYRTCPIGKFYIYPCVVLSFVMLHVLMIGFLLNSVYNNDLSSILIPDSHQRNIIYISLFTAIAISHAILLLLLMSKSYNWITTKLTCKKCFVSPDASVIELHGNTFVTVRDSNYIIDPKTQRRLVYNDNGDKQNTKGGFVEYVCDNNSELYHNGLSVEEAQRRLQVTCGPNVIPVTMPSVIKSVSQDFTKPFYLYQLLIYYTTFYYKIWYMGLLFTTLVLITAAVQIINTRSSRQAIVNMISSNESTTAFSVKRTGNLKQEVLVKDLVPGDVINISQSTTSNIIPCDIKILPNTTTSTTIVLLVVDESTLTGESLPVIKTTGKILYAGTTILQNTNSNLYGVVIATGCNTVRGKMVVSRVVMNNDGNDDESTSVRNIMMLAMGIYGLAAAALCIFFFASHTELADPLSAFGYVVFMLAACIPPVLPVVITIGQVNASRRLRVEHDVITSGNNMTSAGVLDVFCFDKTGTLTTTGLSFVSVVDSSLLLVISSTSNKIITMGMATCHSVMKSPEGGLIGRNVDLEMLRASNASVIENNSLQIDNSKIIKILKRCEFSHTSMTMSVIVQDNTKQQQYVFCKGSYEAMVDKMKSVPENYRNVCSSYVATGMYVLALAYKEFTTSDCDDDRESVESNLNFLGLVLFRNNVKEESRVVLESLRSGGVRNVMITGDNVLTGIYVARSTGMICSTSSRVLIGTFINESVQWKEGDTTDRVYTTDEVICMILTGSNCSENNMIELAITGDDTFAAISDYEVILKNIRVYARMTPEFKSRIVQVLQQQLGLVVGFCGDGGNDCGALKVADVGVALQHTNNNSNSDASAVAGFTTSRLAHVVTILAEGRAALATSNACVKLLLTYGLLGSFLRLGQYYYGVILSEWQWIYTEIGINVILSYWVTKSRPSKAGLVKSSPPTLGSVVNVASVVGQVVFGLIFYFVITVGLVKFSGKDWYCPFEIAHDMDVLKWWEFSDNAIATILFCTIVYQPQVSAFVYSFGHLYREGVFSNTGLILSLVSLVTFDLVLLLSDGGYIIDVFRIATSTNVVGLPDVVIPLSFRITLLVVMVVHAFLVTLYEKVFILGYLSKKRSVKNSITL